MSTLGPDDVARIAKLAHLSLDAEETARIARELDGILAYVKQLEELDVSGIREAAGARAPLGPLGPLRADEPEKSLDRDVVMSQAPKTAEGGFAVPSFVDEG